MSTPDTEQQLYSQALGYHRAGNARNAELVCRRILELNPNSPGAYQLLGIIAFGAGQADVAIELLQRAIVSNPNVAEYYSNLGAVLARAARWQEAMRAFGQAVALRPDLPEAHGNLGQALFQTGNTDQAIAEYEKAISLRGNYAEAFNHLGTALQMKNRLNEAADAFRNAVLAKPGFPEALSNLAGVLQLEGKAGEAIELLNQALAIRPEFCEALTNLGNALHVLGRYEEAAGAYRRAIATRPGASEIHVNLGIALLELGRVDASIEAIRKGLELRPTFADGWYNLGNALRRKGQLDEAVSAYEQCIAIRPDFGEAIANLGNTFRDRGQLDEAIASYCKAIPLTAASWPGGSLIYSVYFHPAFDGNRILQEHRRWNDAHARPLFQLNRRYTNDRDPDRRLKIGYVSPDFRTHCQANFTVPLLSHHDHRAFEVYCYSSVSAPSEITGQIKSYADAWRDIAAMTDDQAAELIARDQIDILIDLTMHMDRTRLLVFARKPAPVQATWLAYPGTTGLETMDYRLSDPRLDPPAAGSGNLPGENDGDYSERTIRLPDSFWCYDPLTREPAVNELPALKNGYITFGCLNNFCKITDPTLDLWARIMRRVPHSRLIVLTPVGLARQWLLDKLQARGIDRGRIEPINRLSREAYLAEYNRFDLCLDTFPYNGHTTTLDSLWMGVPPITLAGRTAVSRGGLSILHNVALSDFVAHTPEEAEEIAVRITSDLPWLAEIRGRLRSTMESSPLMDATRFARNIEMAYRQMWCNWCEGSH